MKFPTFQQYDGIGRILKKFTNAMDAGSIRRRGWLLITKRAIPRGIFLGSGFVWHPGILREIALHPETCTFFPAPQAFVAHKLFRNFKKADDA